MSFQSGFNLPIDRTVQLTDGSGNTYSFDMTGSARSMGRLISFESTSGSDFVTNDAISDGGIEDSMVEHKNWTGTIKIDRRNANADAFNAQWEALYHAGQAQSKFTIHERTTNRDGIAVSYSSFMYINASLKMAGGGSWALGTRVELEFQFHATNRVVA